MNHAFHRGDVAHIVRCGNLDGLIAFIEQQVIAEAAVWCDWNRLVIDLECYPVWRLTLNGHFGVVDPGAFWRVLDNHFGRSGDQFDGTRGGGGVPGLVRCADLDLVRPFQQLLLRAEASLPIYRNGLRAVFESDAGSRVGQTLDFQQVFAHPRAVLQVDQFQHG